MRSIHGIACFLLMMMLAFASCKSKKRTSSRTPHKRSPRTEAPTTTAKKPKPKADPLQVKYAEKLSVSQHEIQNMELYRFVDQWVGTPYRYGGMSSSGVDCSGFSNVLYKEIYQTQLKRTARDIYGDSKPVAKTQLQEGDLVFFNISGKKASHMGVYLQNGYFVHASSSKGVVISNLSNSYYQKYFDRGGRIR